MHKDEFSHGHGHEAVCLEGKVPSELTKRLKCLLPLGLHLPRCFAKSGSSPLSSPCGYYGELA